MDTDSREATLKIYFLLLNGGNSNRRKEVSLPEGTCTYSFTVRPVSPYVVVYCVKMFAIATACQDYTFIVNHLAYTAFLR